MEQVNQERVTEFQAEVLQSVEILWTAAQNKKGRGFTPSQINHIAGYLNSISTALMEHEKAKIAYDAMLGAYIAEHGSEIFNKISGNIIDDSFIQLVDTVVEGEIIEEDTDAASDTSASEDQGGLGEHVEEQVPADEGPDTQGEGLDSPNEGEE